MNKLNLLLKSGSLIMYKRISDFNSSTGRTLTYGNILFLPKLDTCISTFVQILTTENLRNRSRPKQYGYVFRKFLQLATILIIGTVPCLVDYWEPGNFCIPNTELPLN